MICKTCRNGFEKLMFVDECFNCAMSQNNEKTDISEEHLVRSDIPEEWESMFDEDFVYKTKREDGVVAYEEWLSEYSCEEVKDFIKTEIRKAEERGFAKGNKDTLDAYGYQHDSIYNQAITDAVGAVNKHTNNTRTDIVAKLESLKK